jgi:hypothetical protein
MKVAAGGGMNNWLIATENAMRAGDAGHAGSAPGWKSSRADRIFDLSAPPEFPEPA